MLEVMVAVMDALILDSLLMQATAKFTEDLKQAVEDLDRATELAAPDPDLIAGVEMKPAVQPLVLIA